MQFSEGTLQDDILWGKFIGEETFFKSLKGGVILYISIGRNQLFSCQFRLLRTRDGSVGCMPYNIEFDSFEEKYLAVLDKLYDQIQIQQLYVKNISTNRRCMLKMHEIYKIMQHLAYEVVECYYYSDTELIFHLHPKRITIVIKCATIDEYNNTASLAQYLLEHYHNERIFICLSKITGNKRSELIDYINDYIWEHYSLVISNLEGIYIIKNE